MFSYIFGIEKRKERKFFADKVKTAKLNSAKDRSERLSSSLW